MILSTTLPKSSPAFAAHVVHIEGLDLAGKSTATQALLDRHPGSELRRNALTEGNRPFLLADELRRGAGTSAETLGQLYVAALRRDIATYEPPSTETVQDSTILLRSLAFNTVIGATNIADELWDLLPYHPRFRTSIVLTASLRNRRSWVCLGPAGPPQAALPQRTGRSSSRRPHGSGCPRHLP